MSSERAPDPADDRTAHPEAGGPGLPADDDEAPPLLSTQLPNQPDTATNAQWRLIQRLTRLRIQRSPGRRRLRIALIALGWGAGIPAGVFGAFVAEHTNDALGCCTACVSWAALAVACAGVHHRLIERPSWLASQPWYCPSCAYDLAGLPTDRAFACPECGAACDPQVRRRPALTSSDLLEEIRRGDDADLRWVVRRRPQLAERPPAEIVEMMDMAMRDATVGCCTQVGQAAKGFFGCLFLVLGLVVTITGIIDGRWYAVAGAAPIILGSVLLLRLGAPRRERLLRALDAHLGLAPSKD